MPRLMEKKDWMQTVADVGAADSVWYESITADGGLLPLAMPENGMYHVILVKVGDAVQPEKPRRRSARELIGCCRQNYNGLRTTAEIMKELREGEE